MSEQSPWIQRFHPAPEASSRLVCLPHAGGASSYFHPVSAALSPGLDVLAVQYPGRQDRRLEPVLTSIDDLADGVHDALAPWLDRPLSIFGHSMGAMVGYEVARRLTKAGHPPVTLIVSGRRAPDRYRDESIHTRSDAGVIAEIQRLGGTDAQLLSDPELRAMVLPAVRGDFQAVETYRHTEGPQLTCPVQALLGDRDPMATLEETNGWAEHTTGAFELKTFPGGHFYLGEHAPAVIATIRDHIARLTT
ncbi:thioesterase II family protein [Streptomyces profundus]|uniref:thioesterase II family protein n=1 Tax=Streptomyces profundus TaxID=2867410 RepID=UPI001D1679D2|nr:alpha/beta fold hydrolase [Streptomyces sp. MA3_2.13]UED82776.1 alpha/beta fold hydrolase [Streptomyces sp. MA3_2.13]